MTDLSFHTLVEEYLHRRRTQGNYSIEQFAREFPHLQNEIMEEFPGLVVAESLRDQSNASIALPKKIAQYELGEEIGRGGMGIVVSATNPDLDSDFAIKLLPFARMRSPESLQRFRVEAKICASIDHPNIVPVFDYGTDDNFAYLVMRKVKGQSLDQTIADWELMPENHELNWNLVTSIGIQAAQAVHHAHEQGVIHRDLKPANLILEPSGKLWVTDFGLSKVINSESNLSMTGDVLGTPRYMAPEQLRGISNACSDVYSLGMTLYELIGSKCDSFQSEIQEQGLANDTSQTLPDLKTINPKAPATLCEIVMQAVDLDPTQRFATAEELAIALMQSADGTFVGNRRRSDRQASRRNRTRTAAIAIGVASTVALIAYLLDASRTERLAKMLGQPSSVKTALAEEETRKAIINQLPNLLEAAVSTDDQELRTVFADLAVSFMDPDTNTAMTEAQKAEHRKAVNRMREAYITSGSSAFTDPEHVSEIEASRDNYALEGQTFLTRMESLKKEAVASDFSEQWKKNAAHQFSRFQKAVREKSIAPWRQIRIKNILVSLLTVEVDGGSELHRESLRYFVSFLEAELDRVNEPGPIFEKIPYAVEVPAISGDARARQSQLENASDAPVTQQLIEQYSNDPRIESLLKQLHQAGSR